MRRQLQLGAASLLVFMVIGVACVSAAPPDFTKGDKIPEGANHDWTLGATGARGWIFSDKLVTTDARQIAVTKVEKELLAHREARGLQPEIGQLRSLINEIENAGDSPPLRSIDDL